MWLMHKLCFDQKMAISESQVSQQQQQQSATTTTTTTASSAVDNKSNPDPSQEQQEQSGGKNKMEYTWLEPKHDPIATDTNLAEIDFEDFRNEDLAYAFSCGVSLCR